MKTSTLALKLHALAFALALVTAVFLSPPHVLRRSKSFRTSFTDTRMDSP